MSAAIQMSALAREILQDLTDQFEGQTTKRRLQKWLGEPPEAIEAATAELHGLGLVLFADGQVQIRLTNERSAAAGDMRERVRAMMAQGKSSIEIQVRFGLSKGQMSYHRRILKAEGKLPGQAQAHGEGARA